MATPLLVVINFVYNRCSIIPPHHLAAAGSAAHDPRYDSLMGVGELLEARGHRVLVLAQGRWGLKEHPKLVAAINRFGVYPTVHDRQPDLLIRWFGLLEPSIAPWRMHQNVTTLMFENGVFKDSVIVDPKGLLGDSFYVTDLEERVQQNYDDATCRATLAATNATSKRPQSPDIDIPKAIWGNYLFVPTQKFLDLSVRKYSSLSMPDFIEGVAKYGNMSHTPVVIKIHPHLEGTELGQQKSFVARLQSIYQDVYLSHASITFLSQHALATATLNGGTLVDNFIAQAPVASFARSLFSNSTALVYNTSVERGLASLVSQHLPWSAEHKLRQRQVVCWLHDMSMFSFKTPEANVLVLQRHLDAVLRGTGKKIDITSQADSAGRPPRPELDENFAALIERPARKDPCLL